jgi:hypothetical protein
LQINLIVNQAGNPRAKGQVENAHNIVETSFESGFKFTHVPDIDWINAKAAQWMRWYNSTRIHSRHGTTRWAKWLEILPALATFASMNSGVAAGSVPDWSSGLSSEPGCGGVIVSSCIVTAVAWALMTSIDSRATRSHPSTFTSR